MSEKYGEDMPWHLTEDPDVAPSYEELADRIEELEAKLAKAMAALEDFADAADEADEYGFDDFNQAPIDCGQCRAARNALAELQKTPPPEGDGS